MDQPITRKYVETLPLIEVNIAGTKRSVRYDDAHGKIYSLDERGKWNGHVMDYTAPVKPTPKEDADTVEKENSNSVQTAQEPAASLQSAVAAAKQEEPSAPAKETSPQAPVAPPPEQAPAAQEEPDLLDNQEEPLVDDDILEDIVADTSGKKRRKEEYGKVPVFKYILYGCIGLAIIFGIIVSTFGLGRQDPPQEQNPVGLESTEVQSTEAYVETTAPVMIETEPEGTNAPTEETVPLASEPEVPMVQLLMPTAAIIPGQTITADLFLVQGVTEVEYRNLTTTVGLYTERDMANLIGLVATRYIPAGKYLSYDDVGRSFGVVNPWAGETAGYVQVTLPVSVTTENFPYLHWGNSIDLTITVQTKQTNENTGNGEDAETTPDGLEHESSVVESMVIDTYKLSNIRIADVKNTYGESLYSRYYAIGSIPAAFQTDYLANLYQYPEKKLQDTPTHIVVCLTQEQAILISSLSQDTMSVTVTNPVSHSGTTLQNEVYILIQDAQDAISQAWISTEEHP